MGSHLSRDLHLHRVSLKKISKKKKNGQDKPSNDNAMMSRSTSTKTNSPGYNDGGMSMKYPEEIQSHSSSSKKSSSAGITTTISGRDFHSNESSAYWLPKDEEEQDRLIGVQYYNKKKDFSLSLLHSRSRDNLFDAI